MNHAEREPERSEQGLNDYAADAGWGLGARCSQDVGGCTLAGCGPGALWPGLRLRRWPGSSPPPFQPVVRYGNPKSFAVTAQERLPIAGRCSHIAKATERCRSNRADCSKLAGFSDARYGPIEYAWHDRDRLTGPAGQSPSGTCQGVMDFQAVPCGRTCKLSVLLFEVGQYSNVNGVGCFLPNEWCGFPPDKQPPVLADGTHAFTSTGNGHFTIGVLAMHTEWVVRVVGTSVVAERDLSPSSPEHHHRTGCCRSSRGGREEQPGKRSLARVYGLSDLLTRCKFTGESGRR